jgi:hypothetical protein
LDGCPYSTGLWDWVATLYRQTDRVREDIQATLRSWRVQYTENEIVNLCWGLTPGFFIWEIWKERNKIIFHNESLPINNLIETIKQQLRETILSRKIHATTKNPSSKSNKFCKFCNWILRASTYQFTEIHRFMVVP